MQKLGMKRIWTLLVFLTFVSVSFERNMPVKNGTSVATELTDADQVDAKGLRPSGADKQDLERAKRQLVFQSVLAGMIIGGSVFLICGVLIKACAAKDKGKPLSKDGPAVQKGTEGAILVKCQEV